MKSNTNLPQAIQESILDILESNRKDELVKSSKIKQARLIVSLRNKYTIKEKSQRLN